MAHLAWYKMENDIIKEFKELFSYLLSTPEDAFEFFVKDNECSVISLRDKKYTEIKIPEKFQGKPVTAIGDDAFDRCESLTSITLPTSVTAIGSRAFSGCRSLTSVTIPSGVTIIRNGAFMGCESLTSITIPSGVTVINPSTFEGCKSLTNVTIPSGVIAIGCYAFWGCKSLMNVTIPSSVIAIGVDAFRHCRKLQSIIYSGNYDDLKSIFAEYNEGDDHIFACIEQGAKEVQQRRENLRGQKKKI